MRADNQGTLSADQITFINQTINYLTLNGIMELGVLFETPFTDIHDKGVLGVFNPDDTEGIVEIISGINDNAIAA